MYLLILLIAGVVAILVIHNRGETSELYIKKSSGNIPSTDTFTFPTIDMRNHEYITIEGSNNTGTNDAEIIIETSPDGSNWFDSGIRIAPVGDDYFYTSRIDSNYLRAFFNNTSTAVTVTLYFTKTNK